MNQGNNKISHSNNSIHSGVSNTSGKQKIQIEKIINNENLVLPIDSKKKEILDKLSISDELVIVAETGAGKTTRVPQFLSEAGYDVIVTQPRSITARKTSDRIADELGSPNGEEVRYRVGGGGKNRNYSENTKILLATDALQNIYPIVSKKLEQGSKVALVIDEVHERNKNIEILLGRIRLLKKLKKPIKVIYMSATINSDELLQYIGSTGDANKPPQKIEVGGRLFKVTNNRAPSKEIINTIMRLYREGKNILIFQPGKKEIENCITTLKQQGVSATIYPLHSDMDKEEQDKIKIHNNQTIIVATNIAQTGITIEYIDAVVDTGVERRIELVHGVETVVLGNISKSDLKQRAGRAGRCKEGVYYLCHDDPDSKFPEYSVPEIQRTNLDLNYLKVLGITGLKLEDLNLFHKIEPIFIADAKDRLYAVDAISSQIEITPKGKQLSKLGVDVATGAMILEGAKLGCFDQVLKIGAIYQVLGITEFREELNRGTQTIKVGKVPRDLIDNNSDLITQMNVFNYALERNIHNKHQLAAIGLNPKSFNSAKNIYLQLKSSLARLHSKGNQKSGQLQDLIKKSIAAGMGKHIYQLTYDGMYVNRNHDYRTLDKNSFVNSKPDFIVGRPKTIEFSKGELKMKKALLTDITAIPVEIYDDYYYKN